MKIEWTIRAKNSLDKYCEYIKEKASEDQAKKVRRAIVLGAKEIINHPTKYQLDEYYPNNPGNIRRFFKWSYRVVYLVEEDRILILNIFHTSLSEKKIK